MEKPSDKAQMQVALTDPAVFGMFEKRLQSKFRNGIISTGSRADQTVAHKEELAPIGEPYSWD